MRCCASVFIAAGLVASGACAAEDSGAGRWTLAFAAGASHYAIETDSDADVLFDPEPTSAQSHSEAISVAVGYRLSDRWAVQIAYIDFGSVGYEKIWQCTAPGFACPAVARFPIVGRFHARSVDVSTVLSIPITSRLEAFGGIGLAMVSYENSSPGREGNDGYAAFNRTSHRERPLLQLGTRWYFKPQWSAQLTLLGLPDVSDSSETGEANIHSVLLGIRYQFGRKN